MKYIAAIVGGFGLFIFTLGGAIGITLLTALQLILSGRFEALGHLARTTVHVWRECMVVVDAYVARRMQ